MIENVLGKIEQMRRTVAFAMGLFLIANAMHPVQVLSQTGRMMGPHQLHPGQQSDGEVCTFCHTPTNGLGGQPLWATRIGSREFEGFEIEASPGSLGGMGGNSIACLTCHDGAQAPDSAISMPSPPSVGHVPKVRRPGTRDHPVGIPFSGYRSSGPTGANGDGRLNSALIDGQMRWWIDSEAVLNGVRDKTDVVFYTREDGAAPGPFIECGSCHDPHAGRGDMFLRVSSSESNLCRTCHNI